MSLEQHGWFTLILARSVRDFMHFREWLPGHARTPEQCLFHSVR